MVRKKSKYIVEVVLTLDHEVTKKHIKAMVEEALETGSGSYYSYRVRSVDLE